jgi:hypothetical protein
MKAKGSGLRLVEPAPEGPLEQALRRIIREEIRSALAELNSPAAVKTHVSSTELMASLSISRGTLRKMMAEGLPHTRAGKYPRFAIAEVDHWLAEHHSKKSS